MVTFVQDEHNIKRFGLANITIKFSHLRADEMASVLSIVKQATTPITQGDPRYQPYFKCVHYDATGQQEFLYCNGTQARDNTACERVGVASCK